ncbi:hypothetical protein [uncultured Piscinibacter sp.]|uniref:hypothetical protein n=1 Tax=uncultured Piscinibacter sp. TaxID=1131835 RepID=UPI002633A1CF|nr:hypothetical protein [uncultured Piscinibacter sp.]
MTDWFERITGFKEADYEATRARLAVEDGRLVSDAHDRRYAVGRLELPSLADLRARASALLQCAARTKLRAVIGDVRALHRDPVHAGALFQVASQFNLLEMTGPSVSPEEGVTRYMHDRTQGPACAIAAGAATIYRNYLVPIGSEQGQTRQRQLDALAPLGEALSAALRRPVRSLWTMRNGYALCTPEGLAAIGDMLGRADEATRDGLRSRLRIGLHHDVEVTDADPAQAQFVTQAFCSALPVAYTTIAPAIWKPFAMLVLEAAYEATLLAAAIRSAQGQPRTVFLTSLGVGAFGNDEAWIDAALERALRRVDHAGLDVAIFSHGSLRSGLHRLVERFQ